MRASWLQEIPAWLLHGLKIGKATQVVLIGLVCALLVMKYFLRGFTSHKFAAVWILTDVSLKSLLRVLLMEGTEQFVKIRATFAVTSSAALPIGACDKTRPDRPAPPRGTRLDMSFDAHLQAPEGPNISWRALSAKCIPEPTILLC